MAISTQAIYDTANYLGEKYNLSPQLVKYMAAQWHAETAGGTSYMAGLNNLGGLTQTTPNELAQDDGGTNYYRSYNNLQEFAESYYNDFFKWRADELGVDLSKLTSLEEFVHILQDVEGYRYSTESNEYYFNMVAGVLGQYEGMNPAGTDLTVGNYVAKGSGVDLSLSGQDDERFSPYVIPQRVYGKNYNEDRAGFWGKTGDSFLNQWYSNSAIQAGRLMYTAFVNREMLTGTRYRPSEEDMKEISDIFGGDEVILDFLKNNATNRKDLWALVRMKEEDLERERRVESRSFGTHSILGGGAGVLLDPLNFVPVIGEEAIFAKLATRLGTGTLAKLGGNAVVQAVEKSIAQGVINMGDEYMQEKLGSHKANYANAFMLGAGASLGLQALARSGKIVTPALKKVEENLLKNRGKAIKQALHIDDIKVTVSKATRELMEEHQYKNMDDLMRHVVDNPKAPEAMQIKKDIEKAIGRKFRDEKEWQDFIKKYQENPHFLSNEITQGKRLQAKARTLEDIVRGKQEVPEGVSKEAFEPLGNEKATVEIHPDGEIIVYDENGNIIETHLPSGMMGRNLPDGRTEIGDSYLIPSKDSLEDIDGVLKDSDELMDTPHVNPEKPSTITNDAVKIEDEVEKEVEEFVEDVKGILSPDEVFQETQGDLPIPARSIGFLADTNKVLGDYYGKLANSVSNTIRKFAKDFLYDSRQRGHNIGVPIEVITQAMKAEYVPHIDKLKKAFKKYVIDEKRMPTSQLKEEFNEKVVRAYHARYLRGDTTEFSKPIEEAIEALHQIRKVDLKLAERGGIIEDITKIGEPNELWRNVNLHKLSILSSHFKGDELRTILEEYAMQAIQWDKMGVKELQKKHGIAREWAESILWKTKDVSSMNIERELNYYKHRIPMDTSHKLELNINGQDVVFSFDDDLRDYNLMGMVNHVYNRTPTEVAMRQKGYENGSAYVHKVYTQARQELEAAQEKGYITAKQAEEELERLHDAIVQTTHIALDIEDLPQPASVKDRIKRILLGASYAQNGVNMGFANIAEPINSIAVNGVRGLFHYIPPLHKYFYEKFSSKYVGYNQLQHWKDHALGYELADFWLEDPLVDTIEREARKQNLVARVLGATENGVQVFAHMTSMLNQVQTITDYAVRSIKADIIPDLIAWSRGEFDRKLGANIFNEHNLKSAGITDVDGFMKDIQKYLGNIGEEPDALTKSMEAWAKDSSGTYYKMHSLLHNLAQQAVITPTVGNQSLYRKGFILPILLQFKEFSRKTINGHAFRMLGHWNNEYALAIACNALASGMIWAGRTYVYGHAKYHNDEEKREKYFNKVLSVENMLRAGVLRSSAFSGFSYLNDGYEALTGSPSIRTSVNRMEGIEFDGLAGRAYNMATQVPVVNTVMDVGLASSSVAEMLAGQEFTRDDAKAINRLIPFDRYVPLQIWTAQLRDTWYKKLPEKPKEIIKKKGKNRK